MRLLFEWDAIKAENNVRKHKVSFEEGKTVFNDPLLYTFPDLPHSETENRFISLGLSSQRRVLVLTHTERHGKIRIISCRRATPRERRFYEEGIF
jgi:uncharacterized DUF497 family protein